MKHINKILASGKTVISINDMQQLTWLEDKSYTRLVLHRLTKSWVLKNIKPGIFVLPNYDIFELASKMKSKSYISFETVLQKNWIIFQDYHNTITLASNNTLTKTAEWFIFKFHKLSDFILTNTIWITNHKNKYMMATKERAICDMIYLYKNIYFDNIAWLNIYKLEELQHIYNKKTFLLIWELIQNVKHQSS